MSKSIKKTHLSEDAAYLKAHPKEMLWLSTAEMCQRFAFWGVGNLLVLYLIQFFDISTPDATHIYGIFTGVGFFLPVLGGYLTDRWNYSSPIIYGFIATALGCFMLATTIYSLIYPALFLIALGGGIFTPCIYALLGKAYSEKHHLREIGFSIYYAAVNLGVFVAMIVLGLMIKYHGWRAVFITSGIIQLIGLFTFYKARSFFSEKELKPAKKTKKTESTPLSSWEKERLILISIFCFISIFFWASYSQNGSSIVYFAYKFTDRYVFGWEMPTPWIISIEMLYLILLVFPITFLYLYLRSRDAEPTPPMKLSLSMFAMCICYVILVLASEFIPQGARSAEVSPWYMVGAFFLMAISELLMAPISLSLVTNLSPKRFTALFVGIWYFCIGIAYYLGGLVAGLVATMKLTNFFSIFAVLSFIVAFCTLLFTRKLNSMRHLEKFPGEKDPSM